MKIVVSRPLSAQLGDDQALELACDFQTYKMDPVNNFGRTFGRDKGFLFPEIVVSNGIRHVHMETTAVESEWQAVWDRNGEQPEYTSDKMLVYGPIADQTYPAHLMPYMLIAILNPDGHAQMDNIERMREVGELFVEEVEAYSVRLPSDKWVYAK